MSSYADQKSDFMNINNHWKMIMNEKDKEKRGPMIQEHRMMVNKFEKQFMMMNQQQNMPGNQMGKMQRSNKGGMPGNQMGGMQGNNMGGMPGKNMGGMSGQNMNEMSADEHMNMMNTIQMHRSSMHMRGN